MYTSSCAVIITGGGSSTRYGDGNKLMADLNGMPVFIHSVKNLSGFAAKENFILTVPASEKESFIKVLREYGLDEQITVVCGGKTRAESVRNALNAIALADGVVAVHDAARPLVTAELLNRLISCGKRNVIAATPVVDSVKKCDENNRITEEVDRTGLWRASTPQVFDIVQYKDAVGKCLELPGATDDATIMRLAGYEVAVLDEQMENIKLTTVNDLGKIKNILNSRASSKGEL